MMLTNQRFVPRHSGDRFKSSEKWGRSVNIYHTVNMKWTWGEGSTLQNALNFSLSAPQLEGPQMLTRSRLLSLNVTTPYIHGVSMKHDKCLQASPVFCCSSTSMCYAEFKLNNKKMVEAWEKRYISLVLSTACMHIQRFLLSVWYS